jgi:hypothetical protein
MRVPIALTAVLMAACAAPSVDRQPAQEALAGSANGIWWSDPTQVAIITDDTGNRLQSRANDGRVLPLATLPPVTTPRGPGLGQVVRDADGRYLVPRFGFGGAGGVAYVDPRGSIDVVKGLAPERRRIGLWPVRTNTYVVSWFIQQEGRGDASRQGGVSLLTIDPKTTPLTGVERDLVTGLDKPVGVAVRGNVLYVGDQSTRKIYTGDLAQLTSTPGRADALKLLATADNDQFTLGANGDLFTGGHDGAIRRISAAGAVSVFAQGFQSIRGVAFDAGHRRLFAVEYARGTSTLHVLPVD